jgi:hypothetical protein
MVRRIGALVVLAVVAIGVVRGADALLGSGGTDAEASATTTSGVDASATSACARGAAAK